MSPLSTALLWFFGVIFGVGLLCCALAVALLWAWDHEGRLSTLETQSRDHGTRLAKVREALDEEPTEAQKEGDSEEVDREEQN